MGYADPRILPHHFIPDPLTFLDFIMQTFAFLLTAGCTFAQKMSCGTTVQVGDGTFEIDLRPDWAPIGVKRTIALVEGGFFNNLPFFRVVRDHACQPPLLQTFIVWLSGRAATKLPRPVRHQYRP